MTTCGRVPLPAAPERVPQLGAAPEPGAATEFGVAPVFLIAAVPVLGAVPIRMAPGLGVLPGPLLQVPPGLGAVTCAWAERLPLWPWAVTAPASSVALAAFLSRGWCLPWVGWRLAAAPLALWTAAPRCRIGRSSGATRESACQAQDPPGWSRESTAAPEEPPPPPPRRGHLADRHFVWNGASWGVS